MKQSTCCTPKIESPRRERLDAIDAIARRLVYLLVGIVIGSILTAAMGCAHSEIDQQIAHAQQTAKLQAAVATTQATADVAKVEAKNEVDVAHAKANGKLADVAPVSHPVAATNQTVRRVRAPYEVVSVVAGVLACLFVGLLFTPLSWASKIGLPVSLGTAFCAFFTAIALPYLPWLLAAAGVGVLVVLACECVKHKSIKAGLRTAFADIEQEIYGLSGLTLPTPPPPASSPGSTSAPGPTTSAPSFLTSLEAATQNDLATALAKVKSLLGIKTTPAAVPSNAGTKAAPIAV